MRLRRRLRCFVYISLGVCLLVCSATLWLSIDGPLARPPVQRFSLEDARDRMTHRLDHLTHTCDRYNIRPESKSAEYLIPHPPAPQYSVFYFHPRKRLAYCPIYKAASTTMLDWLLHLVGVDRERISTMLSSNRQISDVAREFYPSMDYPAAATLMKESTRVMIVRHPFERLLSAYRDKLEDSQRGPQHGTLHYYQKYGRKIVAKHRRTNQSRIEPTFEEFVDYLIKTDLSLYADDHWIPFYLFCTPCLVDYDLVLKFETLEQDFSLMTNQLETEEKNSPSWKHMTAGGRSSDRIRSYFGQLTKNAISQLYKKYEFDFLLFNYTVDEYFAIARQDE